MNIRGIALKLMHGEFYFAVSRFYTARRAYSIIRGTLARGDALPGDAVGSLFTRSMIAPALAALRADAVAFGFDLPPDLVAELVRHAKTAPCRRPDDAMTFRWSEVKEGRLDAARSVMIAGVEELDRCPGIAAICSDPVIVAVVSGYLGYSPKHIRPRLIWSFPTVAPDDERRRVGQTIDYHYDVNGYNFIYANFYLTGVDARSGAHVMVKGSHKPKPLRMLLHSVRQTDDAVLAQFGAERELLIEGPAGLGFLQDASCFHKALVPQERARLMLQVRYS